MLGITRKLQTLAMITLTAAVLTACGAATTNNTTTSAPATAVTSQPGATGVVPAVTAIASQPGTTAATATANDSGPGMRQGLARMV